MKLRTSCMILVLAFSASLCQAQNYLPDWGSLAHSEPAPEWFRDAKFGIYFHWGVYCVPAYGNEWYPRWMHVEDYVRNQTDNYFEHHLKTYGHPSKFGYHDFVPQFRAEKFDADQWATLFKKAGARYAGPVAEHHDGFAMWDSDVTPWNAADMGPKRDIAGELATAIRKRGMKFVVSFHHARNLQRYAADADAADEDSPRLRFRNSHYPYLEGMPPVSDDPKLRLLYGNLPESEWLDRMWLGKLHEVMDQYQPDLIWFDSWLDQIPEAYLKRFCADYLNRAQQWGKEVVITRKQEDMPLGCTIEDFEKGRLDRTTDTCWLTDDTISLGSWCFTNDLEIKPTKTVLHGLIDIVSKNGCLLLNISPKADGTIPENQERVLLDIGEWLAMNGEAIYETRPWHVFGEGPTHLDKSGGFIKEPEYTAEDIRYTRSKDDVVLYAILLGWPGAGEEVHLESVEYRTGIKSIEMLGSSETIEWRMVESRVDGGLFVTMPSKAPHPLAVCLRITKQF